MIKRPYYLRINDRKSRIDYTRSRISETTISNNQMIDSWSMIVDNNIVGFIIDFITQLERNMTARHATINHREGKIRAHLTYKIECSIYYDKRIIGKYDLFLQVIGTNFDKIIGFSFFSVETLFIMIIPKRRKNDDYKKLMKREKTFDEETLMKYIESIKQDLTSTISVFMSNQFMPNASRSNLSSINVKTSKSTLEQKEFSAISLNDTAVVTKWISSSDINTESNSQDGMALTAK